MSIYSIKSVCLLPLAFLGSLTQNGLFVPILDKYKYVLASFICGKVHCVDKIRMNPPDWYKNYFYLILKYFNIASPIVRLGSFLSLNIHELYTLVILN